MSENNENHNFLKPKVTSWNSLFLSDQQSKTETHPYNKQKTVCLFFLKYKITAD